MTRLRLFDHQSSLPKLPVPSLQDTTAKYLESIRPITTHYQFQNSKALIEKFLKDPVTIDLQQRLIARQKQTASWLYDWWNDWAYMSYRDPVSFNVNYFYAFVDDPIRKLPALRAASIVKQALNFRDLIISQTLTPDTARSGPLCSHQYRFMFNSCRIPAIPSDTTRSSDLSNNFLIAIRKNQFFKIDLDYNGSPLSLADLVIQFEKIYKSAHLSSPVGALTTDNRNVWTQARNLLLQSPTNKFCLDQIEKSVFVVCLDDTSPVTKNEISRACWHGNGANRFFDKSLQFIIFDNGRAGFNGEHSLMDATPTSRLCEFICKELENTPVVLGDLSADLPAPQLLEFEISDTVQAYITNAHIQFDAQVARHDLQVVTFDGYGKTLVKQMQVSPDAFAQMAIQLAYYKMYGRSRPTYESAQTKQFLYGRTETCRSVSVESVEWCKAMQNPNESVEKKGQLGRLAIKAQSEYMANAVNGQGIDRHFLGLRLLLQPGEKTPELFQDPVFQMSSHWNLSTSQITSEYFVGYGWGQVVQDGYGIAYMVKNDSFQFNLVSMHLRNEHLAQYLHQALHEMKAVFTATIPTKAKL